jgi:hypothetical protein
MLQQKQQLQEKPQHWSPAWIAVIAMLGAITLAWLTRLRALPVDWWAIPLWALLGAVVIVMITLIQHHEIGPDRRWYLVYPFRVVLVLCYGGWVTWAALVGRSTWTVTFLLGGTAIFAVGSYICRAPEPPPPPEPGAPPPGDGRPRDWLSWETLIRQSYGGNKPFRVVDIKPWATPADGEQVHVKLPIGIRRKDIGADFCDALAAAKDLPQGCVIRALPGASQGYAVLDVMLRDSLADPIELPDDYSPVSIYDDFAVTYTPQREPIPMNIRQQAMVVGGSPGSGKTTLLHRLILWFARCLDVLIWVCDPNGGGLAEPWVGPWARGECDAPVVDWVADNPVEAAIMTAAASAVAKDRKTSPICLKRKNDANSNLLPVDRDLPGIIVVGDEGGELRQSRDIFAQLAIIGMSRLVQIGRDAAVRAVISVLRGTQDLLDRNLKANAGLRICLRMEEDDEYSYVLGAYPGAINLPHMGSGYTKRPEDGRPVFCRSADLARRKLQEAAITLGNMRHAHGLKLDERATRVLARMTVKDVLDGRDPEPEHLKMPEMQDVKRGLAYTNRWQRYAPQLASMRGEEVEIGRDDLDDEPPVEPDPEPAPPPARSALRQMASPAVMAWMGDGALADPLPAAPAPMSPEPSPAPAAEVGNTVDRLTYQLNEQAGLGEVDGPAADDTEPGNVVEMVGGPVTARQRITVVLMEARALGVERMTGAQIGEEFRLRGWELSRERRRQTLDKLTEMGLVSRDGEFFSLTDQAS